MGNHSPVDLVLEYWNTTLQCWREREFLSPWFSCCCSVISPLPPLPPQAVSQAASLHGWTWVNRQVSPDRFLHSLREILVFRKAPCSARISGRSEHVLNKRRMKDQLNCGVLGRDSSNLTDPDRVVNGQVVQENEIPWQVGILSLQ